MKRFGLALAAYVVAAVAVAPGPARAAVDSVHGYRGPTSSQRAELRQVAHGTWQFYNVAVDPGTHLPLDNVTFAGAAPSAYGRYTLASNVGVYLWAVVAAQDLGLISRAGAHDRLAATLTEIGRLKRDHGYANLAALRTR